LVWITVKDCLCLDSIYRGKQHRNQCQAFCCDRLPHANPPVSSSHTSFGLMCGGFALPVHMSNNYRCKPAPVSGLHMGQDWVALNWTYQSRRASAQTNNGQSIAAQEEKPGIGRFEAQEIRLK